MFTSLWMIRWVDKPTKFKYNCSNSLDVPHIIESKNSVSVIVVLAFASNGNMMPPQFIKIDKKNTDKYNKFLQIVMLPWIKNSYNPEHAMFIEDFASTYGPKQLKNIWRMNCNFCSESIWPSKSFDLNFCN